MPKPQMPKLSKVDISKVWADPSAYATALLVAFLDVYGMEGLQWHPYTIQIEVEADTGAEIPAVNFEKLMTAVMILTSNSFFQSTTDFVRACVVLSGHEPHSEAMILPDCSDLAWGITEALLISPPEEDDENPFSPEIVGFIGHALDTEGILNPPDVLRIATRNQELQDRVNYDYSDDPEMFGAINEMEASKTNDINHVIKGRLRGLVAQLARLPLDNGNTEAMAEKILQNLPGDSDLPLPV